MASILSGISSHIPARDLHLSELGLGQIFQNSPDPSPGLLPEQKSQNNAE
jgi:hypothetical protein